jgi:hypothetical protein
MFNDDDNNCFTHPIHLLPFLYLSCQFGDLDQINLMESCTTPTDLPLLQVASLGSQQGKMSWYEGIQLRPDYDKAS